MDVFILMSHLQLHMLQILIINFLIIKPYCMKRNPALLSEDPYILGEGNWYFPVKLITGSQGSLCEVLGDSFKPVLLMTSKYNEKLFFFFFQLFLILSEVKLYNLQAAMGRFFPHRYGWHFSVSRCFWVCSWQPGAP